MEGRTESVPLIRGLSVVPDQQHQHQHQLEWLPEQRSHKNVNVLVPRPVLYHRPRQGDSGCDGAEDLEGGRILVSGLLQLEERGQSRGRCYAQMLQSGSEDGGRCREPLEAGNVSFSPGTSRRSTALPTPRSQPTRPILHV